MSEHPATTTARRPPPAPTRIGPVTFTWGARTYVMGILNLTPDSFSEDGLLAGATDDDADPVARAVAQAEAMLAAGADLLDVGGESTRPGHAAVDADAERARVVPVIAALRAALERYQARLDALADGTLAVILMSEGAATDVAARAARCALAIRALWPEAPMALVMARGVASPFTPLRELIDRGVASLDAAEQKAVNAFYESLDGLRWYLHYTEDMPSTVQLRLTQLLRALEDEHRLLTAAIGHPDAEGARVVMAKVVGRK